MTIRLSNHPPYVNGVQKHHKYSQSGVDEQIKPEKLSRREQYVYNLLYKSQYNVVELTKITGLSDIRSCIRRIRNKGHTVSDFWVSVNDRRFKKYFVKEVRNEH